MFSPAVLQISRTVVAAQPELAITSSPASSRRRRRSARRSSAVRPPYSPVACLVTMVYALLLFLPDTCAITGYFCAV
ncbi:Uncharacterised protein [Mycobacteroides abscessus subsp. abscessus]|nr:Uncharacterised protein [Mycobacteroides abscessus subsp. abscessus]